MFVDNMYNDYNEYNSEIISGVKLKYSTKPITKNNSREKFSGN